MNPKKITSQASLKTTLENISYRNEVGDAEELENRFIICQPVFACLRRSEVRLARIRRRSGTPHRTSHLSH